MSATVFTPYVCLWQASVLEGKYWKRRVDAVATEYRKWRLFYRDKHVSGQLLVLGLLLGGWEPQLLIWSLTFAPLHHLPLEGHQV